MVIAMFGDYVSSVSVTLPNGTPANEAQAAVGRVSQATGWVLTNAQVRTDRFTSAEAQAQGLFPVRFAGISTITPLVMALSDRDRLFIAFVGTGDATAEQGYFENQYITVDWSQGGSIHSYQVNLTDHGFTDEQQLATPSVRGERAKRGESGWKLPSGILILLFVAALVVGGLIYVVANRAMKRHIV